jgi:AcrR family transcriptional regulator
MNMPRDEMPAFHLAQNVFAEIEEHGVDGLRMARLASRMEQSVGSFYRRWGGRQLCLEAAWRHTMGTIDFEVGRVIRNLSPRWHAFDDVWAALLHSLPRQLHAFLELHSARRRWRRDHSENDGGLVPTLVHYISVGQHLGHVRLGPPLTLAAMVWWTLTGCATGPFRFDSQQHEWCLGAVKRMVLTPDALELDLENLPIDFDDGLPPDLSLTPW